MATLNRDTVIDQITQIIDEYRSGKEKALDRLSDILGTGSGPQPERSGKPLYQLAHQALVQIGGKGRAKDVMPVLKELSGHPNLTEMLTYQALEYGKRSKHNVRRSNGVWSTRHGGH